MSAVGNSSFGRAMAWKWNNIKNDVRETAAAGVRVAKFLADEPAVRAAGKGVLIAGGTGLAIMTGLHAIPSIGATLGEALGITALSAGATAVGLVPVVANHIGRRHGIPATIPLRTRSRGTRALRNSGQCR